MLLLDRMHVPQLLMYIIAPEDTGKALTGELTIKTTRRKFARYFYLLFYPLLPR